MAPLLQLNLFALFLKIANALSRDIDPLTWISEPILSWFEGGCTPWCQTGWYSSPIFIPNPNNITQNIVIGGSYSVRAVYAETGDDFWNHEFSSNQRIWAGLAYKQSFNGKDCIIAARSNAEIKVLDVYGNALIGIISIFIHL